jgi:hypothetical protein
LHRFGWQNIKCRASNQFAIQRIDNDLDINQGPRAVLIRRALSFIWRKACAVSIVKIIFKRID